MSIRFRKGIPVLPFLRLNLSNSGASWTVHLGPWSWNSRRRRNRVDLPGPLSWEQDRGRGQRGSGWPIAVALALSAGFALALVFGALWAWPHVTDQIHRLQTATR